MHRQFLQAEEIRLDQGQMNANEFIDLFRGLGGRNHVYCYSFIESLSKYLKYYLLTCITSAAYAIIKGERLLHLIQAVDRHVRSGNNTESSLLT